MSFYWNFSRLIVAFIATAVAAGASTSLEYIDAGVRHLLALPDATDAQWVELRVNRSQEETGIVSIRALGPALDRVLIEIAFEEEPHFSIADLSLVVDLDGDRSSGDRVQNRDGIEAYMRIVNQTAAGARLFGEAEEVGGEVRVHQDDDRVYFLIETEWLKTVTNPTDIRVYGRYTRPRARADREMVVFVCTPENVRRSTGQGSVLPERESGMVRPSTAYRYWTDQGLHPRDERQFAGRMVGLAYEKRSDKGLTRAMVEPAQPGVFGREKPLPEFRGQYASSGSSNGQFDQPIRLQVLEEYGVDRPAARLVFGVPFAEGELLSNSHLALRNDSGELLPASFPVTVLWPDGSIKWVLADTQLQIAAGELQVFEVVATEEETTEDAEWWRRTASGFVVDTGPLQANLSTGVFRFLENLIVDGNIERGGLSFPRGLALFNEEGTLFTSADGRPDRVDVEITTPERLVIRYEGGYFDTDGNRFQKYVARVGFRKGSAMVDLTVTHINDWLESEFIDFKSLSLPAYTAAAVEAIAFPLDEKTVQQSSGDLYYFQENDHRSVLRSGDTETEAGRVPGAFRIEGASGIWGAVVTDCWQRWPKGLEVRDNLVALHLLPPQPDAAYGSDLPGHLIYPFTGGYYRLKWGMSFTERLHFDFSAEADALALAAEGQRPLVAVLPASRYADSEAFGDVAISEHALAQRWDAFFEESFVAHEGRREKQQEYGFLNYGDWYGERGRNWGNNEYDTAHAFFSQFARTGDRRYFRSALAAARHQADVDIVHAYPDPYHVGAMHIHSIGHTGPSSHRPTHGVWSIAFGGGVQAGNGHTWAEGMVEAWFLTGDAPIMEAVIGLGEHIAWFMAPGFEMNPSAPRYAGWSLRAISAIYRASGDPVHLKAAETIALAAREKQHPNGGWFLERPLDRFDSGQGQKLGQTNFQLGIIIGGLKEYHRLTGDPRIEETFAKAAQFMRETWDNTGGWPYWIAVDATAHPGRPDFLYGVYGYSGDGVAYAGRVLLDDDSYQQLARQVFTEQMDNHEIIASGQRIGYSLRGGNSLLVEIDAFDEK